VILFSLCAGSIIGIMSMLSFNQIARGRFIFLPAVLLAIQLAALGTNNFFQTAFVGTFVIYLSYTLLAIGLEIAFGIGQTKSSYAPRAEYR
jgi:hypothetical protein